MANLHDYWNAIAQGYRTYERAAQIIRWYDAPGDDTEREIARAGIARKDWDRMEILHDKSLEGILYSLGALAAFVKVGPPK